MKRVREGTVCFLGAIRKVRAEKGRCWAASVKGAGSSRCPPWKSWPRASLCGWGNNRAWVPSFSPSLGVLSFEIRASAGITGACMLSHFHCVRLFVTPWTVAHQAPLSVGFSRQEYWSGLPCPPPGDLPDSGIKPVSHTPAYVDKLVLYH